MAFIRYSAQEGDKFDPSEMLNPNELIMRVALGGVGITHLLEPGEYDLTPPIWTRNTYSHNLLVHSNEEATYRMLPLSDEAFTYEVRAELDTDVQPGGRVIRLPEQQPIVVLAARHPIDRSLRLFEAIVFAP